MQCLDCMQTIARLHLYIDRELSEEEVAVVQQHLENCPSCECRFHFDIRIKKLIHERCTIEYAPAHLREAVMRLARGEDVQVDAELKQQIKSDLQGW
jgi:mycothiol system anti-sigma-R factor